MHTNTTDSVLTVDSKVSSDDLVIEMVSCICFVQIKWYFCVFFHLVAEVFTGVAHYSI